MAVLPLQLLICANVLLFTTGFEIQSQYEPINEDVHLDDDPGYNIKKQNLEVSCALPTSWRGRWFQSGLNLQAVGIDQNSILTKGTCLESHEDKFLFYDKSLKCYKCLVINEKHHNVLQYKESPDCEPEKDSLENLCSSINGDAQLYSLFRLDAQAEECPFRGAPFNLSYNRGHGECREPISHVEACTQPTKLIFKFQACPNVDKTESNSEELECLAQWREGSNHYLMGKLETSLGNTNNEETYRCFIWERIREPDKDGQLVTVGYKVAQSGDATCAGVQSATEGARALTLKKLATESGTEKCKFPQWLTSHNFHTMDGSISLRNYHHKNTTLHFVESRAALQNGGNYFGAQTGNHVFGSIVKSGVRLICTSRVDVSHQHTRVLAQHVDGCKSELVCLNLFKRDSHVVEIEVQKRSRWGECGGGSAEHARTLEWITLIGASASQHKCPNLGNYLASGVSADGRYIREQCGASKGDFKAVVLGCGDGGKLEFHSKCSTHELITSFTCLASWRDGETGFLIATPTHRTASAVRRFCFAYTDSDRGLRVSSSTDSCRYNINTGGNWAFNLTTEGPCAERLSSGTSSHTTILPILQTVSVICLSKFYVKAS